MSGLLLIREIAMRRPFLMEAARGSNVVSRGSKRKNLTPDPRAYTSSLARLGVACASPEQRNYSLLRIKIVSELAQHTICSKMEPEDPSPDTRAEEGLQSFSCLVCRQRKVRCDHAQPCGNCRRAKIDCEYVAPVRGKRKRANAPRETLHAKLRRYEDMLKTRGVDVAEPTSAVRAASQDGVSESNDTVESPTSLSVPTPGEEPAAPMGFRSALIKTPGTGPRLVTKEGNTRYYEKYVSASNAIFFSALIGM